MLEMMTLVPAELIMDMIQTAAVHTAAEGSFVPSENPVTTGRVIGVLFGFTLGWSFCGTFARCPFCSRPGKISGVFKGDFDVMEQRPAKYCPMCGKKLRR